MMLLNFVSMTIFFSPITNPSLVTSLFRSFFELENKGGVYNTPTTTMEDCTKKMRNEFTILTSDSIRKVTYLSFVDIRKNICFKSGVV